MDRWMDDLHPNLMNCSWLTLSHRDNCRLPTVVSHYSPMTRWRGFVMGGSQCLSYKWAAVILLFGLSSSLPDHQFHTLQKSVFIFILFRSANVPQQQTWKPSKKRCLCWSWTRRMHWTGLSKLRQTRKEPRRGANRSVMENTHTHTVFLSSQGLCIDFHSFSLIPTT